MFIKLQIVNNNKNKKIWIEIEWQKKGANLRKKRAKTIERNLTF